MIVFLDCTEMHAFALTHSFSQDFRNLFCLSAQRKVHTRAVCKVVRCAKTMCYLDFDHLTSCYCLLYRVANNPVVLGWHEVASATPGQQGASFLPPLGILCIFYCCFFFVAAKERSPEILAKLTLALCDTLESSIFSCIHN